MALYGNVDTEFRDTGFRRAAVAFLAELEERESELNTGKMLCGEFETLAHQLRGAAGLFGALDTEAAATALECALRAGFDSGALAPVIAATAAAMRRDATRLRRTLGEHAGSRHSVRGPACGDPPAGLPGADRAETW